MPLLATCPTGATLSLSAMVAPLMVCEVTLPAWVVAVRVAGDLPARAVVLNRLREAVQCVVRVARRVVGGVRHTVPQERWQIARIGVAVAGRRQRRAPAVGGRDLGDLPCA